MRTKYPILFTRKLNAQQIEYARLKGIEPTIKPALTVEHPAYWEKILAVIAENRRSDWVFTSQKAVQALEIMMQKGLQPEPGITVFAVGPKTQQKLVDLGIKAEIPAIHDAQHLAKYIVNHASRNNRNLIYFRGNRSLQTLQETLDKEGFTLDELEVYRTTLNTISIPERHFEGVVFYSPSAVEAFEQSGGFERQWNYLFAIGPTTAASLDTIDSKDARIIYPKKQQTLYLLNTISKSL